MPHLIIRQTCLQTANTCYRIRFALTKTFDGKLTPETDNFTRLKSQTVHKSISNAAIHTILADEGNDQKYY